MKITEVSYPTDTRKFIVSEKGVEYICYIPAPCNCIGASVFSGEDYVLVEDAKRALAIENACRGYAFYHKGVKK